MKETRLCVIFLLCALTPSWALQVQPEQVHIAYGDEPSEMWVVWSTANDTQTSTVRYFPEGSSEVMTAQGVSRKFTDGGDLKRVQFIHRVKVTGLTPGQKYGYSAGSVEAWSKNFTLTAMQSGSDWSPRLAVYGDLGTANAQSLPRLLAETQQGAYDAFLHIGDFAYDMNVDNGNVGDQFLRQLEPIAANMPYMTCPGNHEMKYNFSNYRHRFVMPGDELSDRMFFSFNMGPAHIISLNTEYFYFLQFGISQPFEQYMWLEKDLQEASKPENRAERPWIITMGHRPMYCSNSDKDDCTRKSSIVRTGVPFIHVFGLEKLFHDYGVDLALWAHEHSYERLWPVYDTKVYNGSEEEPYTNPDAPVHIITGSAGCSEKHNPFLSNTAPWSALRAVDYGYTRMTVHNASHLYMEQVSDDKNGEIIDSIWIKKDHHGPYSKKH